MTPFILFSGADYSPEGTGSCACVGFVGGSIGGGVGRLQGLHGLIVDNMISVQVVTAAGDLITVSETENSDLFWGIRGAGVDFGIILWATYRVADQTNGGQLLNADFIFPASANRSHFKLLKSYGENMPAGLSFLSNINWKEEYNGVGSLFPYLCSWVTNLAQSLDQYPLQCCLLRL